MPVLHLNTYSLGRPLPVSPPSGRPAEVPRVQLRCRIILPNIPRTLDGIIDTGAPLTIVPFDHWSRLHEGIDFAFLPFAPGFRPPEAVVAGWRFPFRLARFLAPVVLMDYAIRIPRPDVIAQFAVGSPPKGPPPIILGRWGGVLQGGRLAVDPDPATGSVAGSLQFA